MSISFKEINLVISELVKLSTVSKSWGLPRKRLVDASSKLTKFELMILDATMRDLDLLKLKDTLLLLDQPYLKMLQNTTTVLLSAIKSFVLKQHH